MQTTHVPNAVFDRHLRDLKIAELKLLLVVIRQTLGWKDEKTESKRKEQDWLCGKQLMEKTGCSDRSISLAIDALVQYRLIQVTDDKGNILNLPSERKGKSRLYFRLGRTLFRGVEKRGTSDEKQGTTVQSSENISLDLRELCADLANKFRITK